MPVHVTRCGSSPSRTSDDLGVVAIRGPMTISQLTLRLSPMPAASGDLTRSRLAGVDVFAARTTAEGPDGIDLYSRRRDMETIVACLEEVATPLVTAPEWELFRLEYGVARSGIEIEEGDTPVEAALERLVALDKPTRFPGRNALAERVRTGAVRRLVGFMASSDTVPPPGAVVFVNGRMVDRVRSSGRSPRHGAIGMTAVPLGADQPGTVLTITDGGRTWPAVVARVPFGSET
ncbi:MAG TPA: glycine cleavage T C-terminal barrel domain-containing protein [Gemmatimonadales bacterium]|nr:glycine cleavage T C-terminal barrel domain-containing protein [Gemmatimonadales bacterium]